MIVERIGFVGLGRMGEPMAHNLLRGGVPLHVWNRTPEALERVVAAGAMAAADARTVLRANPVTLLMLASDRAIDLVLERGTGAFAANVSGRLIVHMGTTAPGYSGALEADIKAAGGRYVEAPVSGSRKPAEEGALVAMLAGEADAVAQVRPLLAPICATSFVCGAVPGALRMKLSVNLYLIVMVAGLVEATHFAARNHVDLGLFRAVLDAGPMASAVSGMKLAKLVDGDLAPQASIDDVLMNSRLVDEAARAAGAAAPLIAESRRLLEQAQALGLGSLDMVGTLRALEAG
jgi:3-hydroxyisobutyrate dehydrogenase